VFLGSIQPAERRLSRFFGSSTRLHATSARGVPSAEAGRTLAAMPAGRRIGVVGATGAVGSVTLDLLRERGHESVRVFASARSAGSRLGDLVVEEATVDALAAGDLDLCFFSVGTEASRQLVPAAVAGGAVCVDKSSAYRLADGVPLVVPEVNGSRAAEHDGIVANPNCCSIPLSLALAPLRDAAGLRRVHVATYQSVSGAGAQAMELLRGRAPDELDLSADWSFDGVEFDEEAKIRAETRKILELPELPLTAACVRVPVLVGHAETVWVETEEPLSAEEAEHVLADAPGLELEPFPTPGRARGLDHALVGRIREDPTVENGLALFVACDNLRKGAALNAIQIAELLLAERAAA
jgi:aspartate-semialdehyde dehydrogenase